MKMQVDIEEWWPVYEINMQGRELDFTDEEYERLNRIFKEFTEAQDFLKQKYHEAEGLGRKGV